MTALGAVIDFTANIVSFKRIGIKDLPLERTSRGHLAIDLLKFEDCKDILDWRERRPL